MSEYIHCSIPLHRERDADLIKWLAQQGPKQKALAAREALRRGIGLDEPLEAVLRRVIDQAIDQKLGNLALTELKPVTNDDQDDPLDDLDFDSLIA